MPRATARLTCFAFTLLAAVTAGASEQDASADPGSPDEAHSYGWGLGLGAISKQQSYTGIGRDTLVVPLIYFENRWVQLLGPRLELKLPDLEWGKDQQLSFGASIELDGSGYRGSDAPILNGMAKRKDGILAGPSAKWSNPFADVSAVWLRDASGASKGQQFRFGLERSFHVGEHFMFTPSATAIWLDSKYANYYYGVRNAEARADRPTYAVDSTLNMELSLRTDWLVDEHQAVFMSLGYTALGSEIKDSPLTDRAGETRVFMGYLYRFR
jgi:outer membrane protein